MPFYLSLQRIQCNTKNTSDFCFMASSSLVAAAGESSESKNVCLFDTLLPPGRSSVIEGNITYSDWLDVSFTRQMVDYAIGVKKCLVTFDRYLLVLPECWQSQSDCSATNCDHIICRGNWICSLASINEVGARQRQSKRLPK